MAVRSAELVKVLSKFQALFSPEKLEYRMAVPADREKIVKFLLTYFSRDEPCNRALKMPLPVLQFIVSDTIDRCLQTSFSTVVTNGQNDGELVGCLLNSVWNRSDSVAEADFQSAECVEFPENVQLFVKLLNSMHSNFWNLAPKNVNAVIHREIVSVATPYMRRGISTRLLTENMSRKMLEKHRIGGIISEATSFANQSFEKKHGFRCLLEKPYSEVVASNGNRVLQLDDGATHLQLNFKSIDEFQDLPE